MNSSVRREPRVNDFTNLSRSDFRSGGGESLSSPPCLDSLDILSTSLRVPCCRPPTSIEHPAKEQEIGRHINEPEVVQSKPEVGPGPHRPTKPTNGTVVL